MKKKLSALVTLVLIAAMCLTACGSPQSNTDRTAGTDSTGSAPAFDGKPITIKMTTTQNSNQQMGKGIALLADKLNAALGNRVNVMVYDSAQLYTGTEEIQACQAGDIQVYFGTGGTQETVSSELMAIKAPYLFPSTDVAYSVLSDETIYNHLFGAFNDDGLSILGFYGAGISIIANKVHPLTAPADFAGLKMRAPGTMDTLNLNALGAAAITTPAEDTYSSVQTGVIDGMITPSSVFIARKFYEVQPYVTNPGMLSFTIDYIICNSEWLNSLPDDVHEAFVQAVNETVDELRAGIETDTNNFFTACEEKGCEVYNMSEDEISVMKDTLSGVYAQLVAGGYVSQETIDLMQAKVAELSA